MRVLTEQDILTEKNARANVLRLLQDHQWHSTIDINNAAGGTEGTRRLRELRKLGIPIERQPCVGSRQWIYRLVENP